MDISSIPTKAPEVTTECLHCHGSGQIYEATEEASYECHMCLATGRKMARGERIKALSADLTAQWSALEWMGR